MNQGNVLNLSKFARDITGLRGKLYAEFGEAYANAVEPIWRKLLTDSAQFSGSFAASYQLSIGPDSSYVTYPKPKEGDIKRKGYWGTIDNTFYEGLDNLNAFRSGEYLYKDLILVNNTPYFEEAAYGPHRPENAGAAAAIFNFRAGIKSIDVNINLGV